MEGMLLGWMGVISILVLLGVYSWQIEPRLLKIRRLAIQDKRFLRSARFVFISDIHVTWFTSKSILAANLRKLRREYAHQPFDFFFLGGDFFDRTDHNEKLLQWFYGEIVSFGVPVYAVLGNHDTRFRGVSNAKVKRMLRENKINLLENESVILNAAGTKIQLIGLRELETSHEYLECRYFIQSPNFYRRTIKNVFWYKRFDKNKPKLYRIVLSHNPDSVYLPGRRRPDLMLSGHTHGGQIILLTWIGLIISQINPHGSFRSWSGEKRLRETILAISSGFGEGLMPFRFGCPPDAYVITLKPWAGERCCSSQL
ncbi:MAG TPA: hypothetical protein HA282_04780 [Nanoarchaeota archaeon]|nr:metallophosphoesterase [Candidatus Pacearchaeota archaeon]HIH17937.1 hypothetical protein [Nanoarchaeota archaeon]HIH34000.1 hypothetical protein [Nanoarchaeota archaeon]HIH51061.1 hypothetical protein [Nanoarchaeota archaeon]HIH66497.1 hypothetical protein [Nanoarchaeota archaeon]